MNATLSPLFGALGQLNLWSIAVSAVSCFFLGGLWYSPALFEGAWMRANGYTAEQVRQLPGILGVPGFAATFMTYLALATVLALLLQALGLRGVAAGMALGALIWLGFVATTGLAVNLFSFHPLSGWAIDAGFQLTALLLAGAILGAWR